MYLWLVILQASTSSSHHTKPDLYHYNLIQDGSSIRIEVNIIKLRIRVSKVRLYHNSRYMVVSNFEDINQVMEVNGTYFVR